MAHLGRVGTATADTGVSSLAITLTSGVPAGATILIGCVWESAAASIPVVDSVVDSSGNTYVPAGDTAAGGPLNATVASAVLRGTVTTPLDVNDTITVTISGGTRSRWCLQADAFDDLTADPLDRTATTGNSSPSSAAPSTGATPETTAPHELLYAVFGFGGGRTVTDLGGWTGDTKLETTAGSGNRALQVIHKYVTVTGAYDATITLSSSSTYAACMATYTYTPPDPGDPVAQVSQVAMEVPNPGNAAVAKIAQVSLETPQASVGEVRVSQVALTTPAGAGQPYTGLKVARGGAWWNAGVSVLG